MVQGESYGQTILSYGRRDGLPRVFHVIILYEEYLMFIPSYHKDGVTAFHVLSPTFGLCYIWKLCVSVRSYVRMYDTNTPLQNCMVEFEDGIYHVYIC